jgi:hypothetical protein
MAEARSSSKGGTAMKCTHCGRALLKAHTVLGMTLGSECVEKYAGLEGMLTAAGITFPKEFPMIAKGVDSFGSNPEFYELVSRAAQFGVKLQIKADFSTTPPTDKILGVRRADPSRILSYTDTLAAFATQLQGGAV